MTARMLHISDQLELPLDTVTKTIAILAQRRKGKTFTASVVAEEMVYAKLPWVALDPTGAWWGLRASADGKGPGLPVVILGGQHGDIPLERGGGRLVADLVLDQPGWYVIDFSLFPSGAADREFATDFAERLYRRKGQPDIDFPLHLFIDEADKFVPQRVGGGRGEARESDQRLLGAVEAIVRRGGLRGLGATLISQRAAVVNKNVLEQIDVLLTLRTVGPNDRNAIDDYLKADADNEQRKILMGSLASLELGEAWVWEPGGDPPLFDRIRIRQRHTFNSSATPKPGERKVEPRSYAEVDLAAVKEAMAATIERAKADDPKELRQRITQLERELRAAQSAVAPPERVEVPILDDGVVVRLEELFRPAVDLLGQVRAQLLTAANQNVMTGPTSAPVRKQDIVSANRTTKRLETAPTRSAPQVRTSAREGDVHLPGPQRKLLVVLATYGPRTKRQLALQAGYAETGGGFNNPLGAIRSAGYVTRGEPIEITEAGLEALGSFDPLPSGPDLLDHWLGNLPGPAKKILATLVDAGGSCPKEELAERAGYIASGGGFNNPLGRLRTLGLVDRGEPVRLTEEFAEAIA